MADEADIANETADRMLAHARSQQIAAANAAKLHPNGSCHYCHQTLNTPLALFCDSDCRNDYEEEKRLKNRR